MQMLPFAAHLSYSPVGPDIKRKGWSRRLTPASTLSRSWLGKARRRALYRDFSADKPETATAADITMKKGLRSNLFALCCLPPCVFPPTPKRMPHARKPKFRPAATPTPDRPVPVLSRPIKFIDRTSRKRPGNHLFDFDRSAHRQFGRALDQRRRALKATAKATARKTPVLR